MTYIRPTLLVYDIHPSAPLAQSVVNVTFTTTPDTKWDGTRIEEELTKENKWTLW